MTNQQVTTAVLALLVIVLIAMIVRVLRKDGSQNDSKAVLAGVQNRVAKTAVAVAPVARQATTKARGVIYVESTRRPSNAEMKSLIDYYVDLVSRDGGDRHQATYEFVDPCHKTWLSAKEDSQFLFSIPISGARSYYFRRRKYSDKLDGVEHRRCPGKNVWLFNRQ